MIKIVICDDEKIFLDKIKKSVDSFFSEKDINTCIKCYQKSSDLISNIKDNTDIFFLDILMPDNSGLELAAIIRKFHPDSHIIFVSSMEDAVFTSIKFSPLRFIRKELISDEMPEALNAFLNNFQSIHNVIEINNNGNTIILPINSINFAESNKHYIDLYTDTEVFTIRGKLSDYEKIFSLENIVRINQSYMVNLAYVMKYDSSSVTLHNNYQINIGRKYKEAFKKAFFTYKRKYYHASFL